MKYYAGIGSRETPNEFLMLFTSVAMTLAQQGYTLRSGHAQGADSAFERGCNIAAGKKEIYLPWYNFEASNSDLVVKNKEAFEIAEKYHPYWFNLSEGAKKLQARNSHQVLGKDLKTPSDFVLCWTKNGSGSGGTGQAIRIAKDYNIPVFDAGKHKDIKVCENELNEFLKSR